jgi:hypothetical protein
MQIKRVVWYTLTLSLSLSPPYASIIMVWTLLSPALNLTLPHTITTITTKTNSYNRTQWWCTTQRSRRNTLTRANAADKDKDTTPDFSPFAFVTDNPSSRDAIQLPESPAEDGNVGQMLYVTSHSPFCFNLILQRNLQRWLSYHLYSWPIY